MIDVDVILVDRNERGYTFEYVDSNENGVLLHIEIEVPAVWEKGPGDKGPAALLEHGLVGTRWHLTHTPGERACFHLYREWAES